MTQRTLSYAFFEHLLLHPYRLRSSPSTLPQAHPPHIPHRHASAYRHATPVTTSNTRLPPAIAQTLDERIGTLRVQRVDADNKIQEPELLRLLLSRIDRSVNHLRKVAETAEGVPIVKVVTRESLVQLARSKEAVAKKKDVSELAKQVELNWAVSENDLAHRLKKIEEFLSEGKRVEVMIAPKKRGRRASPEECQELLARLRETMEGVEGAEQWKEMQGVPGKVMEMYFKGREENQAELREQALQGRDEKLRRKETEREEKRVKQEARMKRKEEETRRLQEEKKRLGIPIA